MRPYIGYLASNHMPLDHGPVLAVGAQRLEELIMLLVSPATGHLLLHGHRFQWLFIVFLDLLVFLYAKLLWGNELVFLLLLP